ncbi:hypothetical protein C1646_701957 [Rhizophagus diaphanus]|nr:hypothetical protein C1646_701957 [Rhizophagus diaphanus] [Rhizophagus sp. MUCL 43196]
MEFYNLITPVHFLLSRIIWKFFCCCCCIYIVLFVPLLSYSNTFLLMIGSFFTKFSTNHILFAT